MKDSGVPENQKFIRVLQRCFSPEEWLILEANERFTKAVAAIKSVGEVEDMTLVAHRLLFEADQQSNCPPSRPAPSKPQDSEARS